MWRTQFEVRVMLNTNSQIVSNHQPHDCLLNHLFRRRSKKTSKLRVAGLCVGNSPVTGEFPAQRASNAENVSIWWRHHVNLNLAKSCLSITYFAVAQTFWIFAQSTAVAFVPRFSLSRRNLWKSTTTLRCSVQNNSGILEMDITGKREHARFQLKRDFELIINFVTGSW